MMPSDALQTFLVEVTAWAAGRPEVRALALVGSHARGAARPDSDVDLVILTERPRDLLDDVAWTRAFGEVARSALEPFGRVTSVRVGYASGLEVEFGVASLDWARAPDAGTLRVARGGLRVLLDRDGMLAALRSAS